MAKDHLYAVRMYPQDSDTESMLENYEYYEAYGILVDPLNLSFEAEWELIKSLMPNAKLYQILRNFEERFRLKHLEDMGPGNTPRTEAVRQCFLAEWKTFTSQSPFWAMARNEKDEVRRSKGLRAEGPFGLPIYERSKLLKTDKAEVRQFRPVRDDDQSYGFEAEVSLPVPEYETDPSDCFEASTRVVNTHPRTREFDERTKWNLLKFCLHDPIARQLARELEEANGHGTAFRRETSHFWKLMPIQDKAGLETSPGSEPNGIWPCKLRYQFRRVRSLATGRSRDPRECV